MNFEKIKKIILILIVEIVLFKEICAQYQVDLQALDILISNDDEFYNLDGIKVKRFGRNQPHMFHGEMIFHKELGTDIDWSCILYKKQGQEYRQTPFKVTGNVCEVLKRPDPFTEQVWKYTDLPPKESCPFPPGIYHINHMYVGNLTGLPPVMDSGDYSLKFEFANKDNKIVQGGQIYITIYNKIMGAFGK
jgi:hypothetical protein